VHDGGEAAGGTRERGRARPWPSFDDAALLWRAEVKMNKPALRAEVRAARDAFFAHRPAPIAPPPEFLERLADGLTVTSYVPLGSEADPVLLARAAVEAGCAIALPHVTTRTAPMRFLAWDAADDLHAGPMGLRQPHHAAPALAPDIILTPMLAFDAKLDRLGQGAGYYDRAFAEFPDALRIGVAWSVQRMDSLPVDAWDVPLDAVITEHGWISRS
jgi:5-formyltetrahydrofolate cyclo-ligase